MGRLGSEQDPITGAVITANNEDIIAVVSMLVGSLRQRIKYIPYDHPTQINPNKNIGFFIVNKLDDIKQLQQLYHQKNRPMPPVIHLVHPNVLAELDYGVECPGLDITAIPQADLDARDVTLNFTMFNQRIKKLLENTPKG